MEPPYDIRPFTTIESIQLGWMCVLLVFFFFLTFFHGGFVVPYESFVVVTDGVKSLAQSFQRNNKESNTKYH